MEELEIPLWAGTVALLLNAFKGYLPTVTKLSFDKAGIRECNNKCDQLSKEIVDLKTENQLTNKKYDDVNKKYYILLGSMSVIKSKLTDLGFDDITMLTTKN